MRELPSGTVTLLFTDIEGSSQRWEDDQEAMRVAHGLHDELVRDAIQASHGYAFAHTGDGFGAAFARAADAAEAAITIQHCLQNADWGGAERLKVRIGLHTGEAVPVEGDYFGPTANRSARVTDVANGDQIACSTTTAALLTGVTVESAGPHELRGIGVEEVFVITDERFVASDRGFRKLIEPSNLPRIFTSFVGREDIAEQVTTQLGDPPNIVTLVGPGGVGKTRLAVEIANSLRRDYLESVYFCDLSSLADGAAVDDAIAEVVGARRQPEMTLLESIVDYVSGRKTLLVIDNVEHVLEAAREVVGALYEVDGTAIIVTGREPLGLPGETVVPVQPLDVGSAAALLFEARARERSPDFTLDETNRDVVIELVGHLDGMPLAIELAAAWLPVMSPAEILDRLSDRFELLTSGRSDARHTTLRDTVQWSYDLLTPVEATLFTRVSVFSGGFTMKAAEAVCADELVPPGQVADTLRALVDKSMVITTTDGTTTRFGMLETLRGFGQEQMQIQETEAESRSRHADYFGSFAAEQATRLYSPAEAHAWRLLGQDWDNLRAALDFFRADGARDAAIALVLDLAWFGAYSMRFEAFSWASELLAEPGIEDGAGYAGLCGAAALGAYFTVDDQAVELAEAGLRADPDDPTGLCRTALAAHYLNNVHTVEASDALTSEWLATEPETIGNQIWAHGFRVFHVCTHAPSAEAVHQARAARQLATETGSPSVEAVACWAEGQVIAMNSIEAGIRTWRDGLEWPRSLPGAHLVEHLLIGLILHFEARNADLHDYLGQCRDALQRAVKQHYVAGTSHLFGVTAIALVRAGRAETGAQAARCHDRQRSHIPRGNATRMPSSGPSVTTPKPP